jgi:hypothetical protein
MAMATTTKVAEDVAARVFEAMRLAGWRVDGRLRLFR